MKINYQDLQKKINVKFKNLDLLVQSLTHKSFDTKKNYLVEKHFIQFI